MHFTSESALTCGLVIGIATAIVSLFGGRIGGVSGIAGVYVIGYLLS